MFVRSSDAGSASFVDCIRRCYWCSKLLLIVLESGAGASGAGASGAGRW